MKSVVEGFLQNHRTVWVGMDLLNYGILNVLSLLLSQDTCNFFFSFTIMQLPQRGSEPLPNNVVIGYCLDVYKLYFPNVQSTKLRILLPGCMCSSAQPPVFEQLSERMFIGIYLQKHTIICKSVVNIPPVLIMALKIINGLVIRHIGVHGI